MTEVIGVRFKEKGKVYFFDPVGRRIEQGQRVIVETAKGVEIADCVETNHSVEDAAVRHPLRRVIRIATPEDLKWADELERKEAEAYSICCERIRSHQLDMKLVDVECSFEGNKILFFFTSDGRVDFRELVKDLAAVFKTRIELRQIGVRDEARMLGGLGICGNPFCCSAFLDDFEPVSIKMAKTQGLSLNPTKISGVCGRLMCCLKYEQDAYEELVKSVPKVDSFVETPSGKGSVLDVNILKRTVRVRLEDTAETQIRTYGADEVDVLGGKAKRAEYLAQRAEEKEQEAKEPLRLRKPPLRRAATQPETAAELEIAAPRSPAPEEAAPTQENQRLRQFRPKNQRGNNNRNNRNNRPHGRDEGEKKPAEAQTPQPVRADAPEKEQKREEQPRRPYRPHRNPRSGERKQQPRQPEAAAERPAANKPAADKPAADGAPQKPAQSQQGGGRFNRYRRRYPRRQGGEQGRSNGQGE